VESYYQSCKCIRWIPSAAGFDGYIHVSSQCKCLLFIAYWSLLRHGKIPTLKISLIQIFRAHLWQKSNVSQRTAVPLCSNLFLIKSMKVLSWIYARSLIKNLSRCKLRPSRRRLSTLVRVTRWTRPVQIFFFSQHTRSVCLFKSSTDWLICPFCTVEYFSTITGHWCKLQFYIASCPNSPLIR